MKTPTIPVCPARGSRDTTSHGRHDPIHNGTRSLRARTSCGKVFSEMTGTPMQGIKTPISKVAAALRLCGEGLGPRATARILSVHKKTIAEVPVVRLGIMVAALRLDEILMMPKACMLPKRQQVGPSLPFPPDPERRLTVV